MGISEENFYFDLGSCITKLAMTVFNTGMTDLEKRKRYLMDLLAEKLKSSKISNFILQTTGLLQIPGQKITFLLVPRLLMFPAVNGGQKIAEKESRFLLFLFKFYFIHFLEVNEAQKRGLKIPTKIMDFLWNCKSSSPS